MGFMDRITNMLFPQEYICLFCKGDTHYRKDYICTTCIKLIELANREVGLELPGIGKVYYSTLYNRFIREKLHAFKFQGKSYLYKPFGEILINTIKEKGLETNIDAITFVPIHKRKKALKGYNQSELLAMYISKQLGIPLLDNHILKVKWTKDQSTLGKIDREKNLKDCFKAINIEDFIGKEILLIDDIITTGTTMEECSKVFIENKASRVHGLALTSSRYSDD